MESILLPNREATHQKLKAMAPLIGLEGLDLLGKCLELDPVKRITAEKALSHPFFDSLKINSQIMKAPGCTSLCAPANYFPNTAPLCHIESMFANLLQEENELLPKSDYLSRQEQITEHMRCILVDWLIDVSVHFEVQDETLHYCISYIDRTLSLMSVEKAKLQLIGVTCLKLADVFNERSKEYYKQENSNEYAYITADEYLPAEIVTTEKTLLQTLKFKLVTPTTMHFLKAYLALLEADEKTGLFAMFLTDLQLLNYSILKFKPSLIALASLYLSCATYGAQLSADFFDDHFKTEVLKRHSINEFYGCVLTIRKFWDNMRTGAEYAHFEAVFTKYHYNYDMNVRLTSPPVIELPMVKKWLLPSVPPVQAQL
jgi:hypothetical protein